jgi:phytanoyl-CoA dioxygenase PhyH
MNGRITTAELASPYAAKPAAMLTELQWWRLRRVHGWTNGLSTDVLNRTLLIGRRAKNESTVHSATLGGDLPPAGAKEFADRVRADSHVVLPFGLDVSVCDDVVSYCLSLKCEPYPRPPSSAEVITFDPDQPQAPMNFFRLRQGLHRHPAVAALMNDPALVAIARDYLGCEPILDSCQIWASPAFGSTPSSEAAQLFHYDMAHPRFIKFFVYLTDVGPDNGPHCVVRTSHRRDAAGWKLRIGTARITDEVIDRIYPGMTRELVGPKGTIIAEDTRAFHKGKHPRQGCRFVMELYFVNAIVGKGVPESERVRRELLASSRL